MKIAVFFPGIGYHCDKPLLYYSRQIIKELEFDKIISLDYSYAAGNIRGNEEKMKEAFEALYKQAEKSLESVSFDEYDEIVFISKSVGTIIASAYSNNYKIKCRHVLYTPLKYTFEYHHDKAISFIGDQDPWSIVPEVVELAKAKGVQINVHEGLNHSMEASDTVKNTQIMTQIMIATKEFLLDRSI